MRENDAHATIVWGPFAALPAREAAPGITMRPMTGERLMLCAVEMVPNAVLPPHRHPHEQGGVVIEGELLFTVGGETKRLGPGDGFVVGGDVEHSAVAGPAGARTLDVFTPPRDDFRG